MLTNENLSAYSVARVTTTVRERGKEVRMPSQADSASPKVVKPPVVTQVSSNSNPSGMGGWMTLDQLKPVLAAATQGLEFATLDRMIKKLDLEAAKRRVNGKVEYNTNSVNGSYRGLFQMGRDAWTDIERKLGVGYDKVFDPAINARAAALYIENNVNVARRKGYTGPITDDVVYAMHNQGVSGFLRMVNGGSVKGEQSGLAKRVIANAVQSGQSVI